MDAVPLPKRRVDKILSTAKQRAQRKASVPRAVRALAKRRAVEFGRVVKLAKTLNQAQITVARR